MHILKKYSIKKVYSNYFMCSCLALYIELSLNYVVFSVNMVMKKLVLN